MSALRHNRTAAYVVPLIVFLAVMMLMSWPGLIWEHPAAPWWRFQPQHWIYPLQTVLCLGLVTFWWRQYNFRPLTVSGVLLGVAAAAVGMAIWFAPNWLYRAGVWENEWFGFADRSEAGFDPYIFPEGSLAWWSTVVARFLRMTVAVPFVEELFWRGFLWRYLASEDGNWENTQVGAKSLRAWIGSSLAMTIAHPSDLLACFIWAMIAGWLLMRTRSLGVCIIYHAASNLILGIYAMATREWGWW